MNPYREPLPLRPCPDCGKTMENIHRTKCFDCRRAWRRKEKREAARRKRLEASHAAT